MGWTLFLDRDGVINEKLENDYVKDWSDFRFCENSLIALADLTKKFKNIFIVTNQRGIGKGIFSEAKIHEIHKKMLIEIEKSSGKIDKIYYCPEIDDDAICRKPNIGMALDAKRDFPEINFSKSFMLGDSLSDLEFGKRLGMKRVYISPPKVTISNLQEDDFDFQFNSLYEFSVECENLILD